MTLYMVLAACWGVLQLAALGWLAGRSVRLSTLFMCVVAGVYACGVATLILQIGYTRAIAAVTGDPLSEVVRTASYTVDPFIEEVVKITPLLLVALHTRTRRQWGMTDYVLLGAGLGAGFGLLEAILRFSHLADRAIGMRDGWAIPSGFVATYVPDGGAIVGSWLPAPATSETLSIAFEPQTFLHLAWSAIAGLGVGVLLRGKGPLRLLGVLPILYASAAHAALNYDLSLTRQNPLGDILAAPFVGLNRLLWLLPPVCLAIAAYFDRRDLARIPDALKFPELFGFALRRPPWTVLIALRYLRLRRSVQYSQAAEPLHGNVVTVAGMMRRSDWSRVKPPDFASFAGKLVRDWRIWVWLGLSAPAIIYFVLAGFPATAFLQEVLIDASYVLIGFLFAGLAWLVWQLIAALRALRPALAHALGENPARTALRLLSGGGALFAGVYVFLSGTDLSQRAIRNLHVLDALAGALIAVVLLLALAALFTMFPPGGLALAGGGMLGGSISISGTLLLETAIVGAISGVLLAEAADGGGGSSRDDGGDGGGGRHNNRDDFPEDDFDGTGMSMDEVAQLTHRHTGAGDMHIGGSAPRPTLDQITNTMSYGTRSELPGQNAVQYVRDGIRVIVNRDLPWRSTAYFIGG